MFAPQSWIAPEDEMEAKFPVNTDPIYLTSDLPELMKVTDLGLETFGRLLPDWFGCLVEVS